MKKCCQFGINITEKTENKCEQITTCLDRYIPPRHPAKWLESGERGLWCSGFLVLQPLNCFQKNTKRVGDAPFSRTPMPCALWCSQPSRGMVATLLALPETLEKLSVFFSLSWNTRKTPNQVSKQNCPHCRLSVSLPYLSTSETGMLNANVFSPENDIHASKNVLVCCKTKTMAVLLANYGKRHTILWYQLWPCKFHR